MSDIIDHNTILNKSSFRVRKRARKSSSFLNENDFQEKRFDSLKDKWCN